VILFGGRVSPNLFIRRLIRWYSVLCRENETVKNMILLRKLGVIVLVVFAAFAMPTHFYWAVAALIAAALFAVAHLGFAFKANPSIGANKADVMLFASLAIFSAYVLAESMASTETIAFVFGVAVTAHLFFAILSPSRRQLRPA